MGYYGWKPYVSVGARQKMAEKAAAKAKKEGQLYAPIAAYRGAVAKTVWGKAWCDNLAAYSDYANRLPRGASYVRNGSVIDLQLSAGKVTALVMGSSLYQINVMVMPVEQKRWKSVCTDCSGSIASLVEILQGKLSGAVMQRICEPGKGLMPSPQDIRFDCSCPDWAGMCKHVAAVLYGVGARLDTQPELLFTLRHVDAKDLVQAAGTGLASAQKASTSARVLDGALLDDVFGLEMAQDAGSVQPAAPRVKKVVTSTVKATGKATGKVPAAKKITAKTVAAKKVAAKKVAAKNVLTKEASGKSVLANKLAVKQTGTPKPAAKKSAVKKPVVKKPAAKKATVKKVVAKKAAPAKKPPAKKAVAKKAVAKK
jgi:uncharacterized Zn finger protein